MHAPCARNDMFFISLANMHVCACKINDIEAVVQSAHIHTRCVHDNLHKYTCMSVTYMPSLVHMHVDVYMNHKARMTV